MDDYFQGKWEDGYDTAMSSVIEFVKELRETCDKKVFIDAASNSAYNVGVSNTLRKVEEYATKEGGLYGRITQ